MKLRCRAGDLAIITKEEPGCEANIGRIVRVSGPVVVREDVGATWLIYPAGTGNWRCIRSCPAGGAVVRNALFPGQLANMEHPDQWMVPFRGHRRAAANSDNVKRRPRPAVAVADTAI